MLRGLLGLALFTALGGFLACGGGTDRLRSSCVEGFVTFTHTIPDASECSSVGYKDCGPEYSSDCVHYCAFGRCQPAPCASDADCAALGAQYECAEYLVEGEPSYGKWCRVASCPKGTTGCPCLSGACSDGSTCEGGSCVFNCSPGCRVKGVSGGVVCCGGALCSGDCIGTPCCP